MDKRQKKQMRNKSRDQQRAAARAKLPLPPAELTALFDMLNVELPRQGCDHSRRMTEAWLKSRALDVESVFAWLDANGGFCDCEVLFNSEQYFEESMRGYD